jgi:hypothetical protein
MLKNLFTHRRRPQEPRKVRREPDPMPRIRWYG